ncbi:alpha/beta hydrolase [Nocardia otitidiscaviarum]|uniref:alpha/beta hydrolase n=1 Tax=Nocardia otitidiscaviarum TaxID=1823 RepID=UPI0018940C41|nr:alpha/beta hydrolase [Nocardia otitidiscaviarum]MBF6182395.1 alpha/beta hydrolase [Nocardia otitidiscaviarum]
MRIRTLSAALSSVWIAVAALATTLAPVATADTTVTKVENKVEIRCAFRILKQSSDWYFPAGNPKGLLWLQHGFSAANDAMDDTARKFAAQGFLVFAPTLPTSSLLGCTIANLGNNTDFLHNVADLFGKSADPSDKLGRSFADAKAKAGRPELALPTSWVFAGHSAGGEAVPYVAQELRADYPSAFAKLRGVILFDPVKSIIGNNLSSSLNHLSNSTLPVVAVSAPPYSCNRNGSGTAEVLEQLPRPFLGVLVTTASHIDVEASSAPGPDRFACGTPQSKNVDALQRLSVAWAGDFVSGSTTADYYPGGAYFQSLVSAGILEPLS